MIRRIACLLLVPVLFANQLTVCCAHSHKGQSASAPHIHLSWSSHGHSHTHSHSHHGGHGYDHAHSHHDSHQHHEPTNNNSEQHDSDLNLNQQNPISDHHEDDFIYCTDSNYLTQSNSNRIADVYRLAMSNDLDLNVAPMTDRPRHAMSVDACARYGGDIFLLTRSMRL